MWRMQAMFSCVDKFISRPGEAEKIEGSGAARPAVSRWMPRSASGAAAVSQSPTLAPQPSHSTRTPMKLVCARAKGSFQLWAQRRGRCEAHICCAACCLQHVTGMGPVEHDVILFHLGASPVDGATASAGHAAQCCRAALSVWSRSCYSLLATSILPAQCAPLHCAGGQQASWPPWLVPLWPWPSGARALLRPPASAPGGWEAAAASCTLLSLAKRFKRCQLTQIQQYSPLIQIFIAMSAPWNICFCVVNIVSVARCTTKNSPGRAWPRLARVSIFVRAYQRYQQALAAKFAGSQDAGVFEQQEKTRVSPPGLPDPVCFCSVRCVATRSAVILSAGRALSLVQKDRWGYATVRSRTG